MLGDGGCERKKRTTFFVSKIYLIYCICCLYIQQLVFVTSTFKIQKVTCKYSVLETMAQKCCEVTLTLESPLVSEPSDDVLKCTI